MDISTLFPSKFLKASDVKNSPRQLVIESVTQEEVSQGEMKPVVRFQGQQQGMVMNKTNSMLIAHAFGTETDNWRGKAIELYSEPVSMQGRIVDAIRVRMPRAPAPAITEDVPASVESGNWD